MKLYHYDHCPYCVKARMIFGLKGVPVEEVVLLNDDEKTPIDMIGAKMLPILVKDSGEAMGESLDIISYVDKLPGFGGSIINEGPSHAGLAQWMQEARAYHYALAMPRWTQMGLEEFATEEAIAYFTNKKEKSIGVFSQALAQTEALRTQAQSALSQLEGLFSFEDYVHGDLSLDDFHLFATLRVLTTVRGLEFPPAVGEYMDRLSAKSGVPLHWEKSL